MFFIKKFFNKDDVYSIMNEIGKTLNRLNLANKFSCLYFYCKWCEDTEFNGNTIDAKIIEEITNVLTSLGVESPGLNDVILDILNFKKLRKELIIFCNENNINTIFLFKSFEMWRNFYAFLIEIISNRKISMLQTSKDGLNKQSNENHSHYICKSIWFTTKIDQAGLWSAQWNLETVNNLWLCGPFGPNEHEFEFENK